MRIVRVAAALAVAALIGAVHASVAANAAPTGLHGFLLRTDEPAQTSFSRTPAFAWNPVPGALRYEFQLSLSDTFRDNSVIYSDLSVVAPVEAPGITLPWITGDPHSLYARVRAMFPNGTATAWSDSFGFDMVPPAPPVPMTGYPGVLRWTPVEGAAAYEVWLIDVKKFVPTTTNVLDEREFYTFHEAANWIGTIRWRVRAIRDDIQFTGNTGTNRYNKIPVVQYGAWSPIYSSANPARSGGSIKLLGTVSDVYSDGSPASPAHKIMPAFMWTGNQALDGTTAELYRVYGFSDKQCLNPVFIGSVVGGAAYAPRPYGSLVLPTSPGGVAGARTAYLSDGVEPAGFMNDWTSLSGPSAPNEDQPHVTPQTIVPGTPGDNGSSSSGSSSSGSSSSGAGKPPAGTLIWSGDFGAPIDVWDTEWPKAGFYWTVVPVAAEQPNYLATSVATPGALSGDTVIPVTSTAGFSVGDQLTVGVGGKQEVVTVNGVSDKSLTVSSKILCGHAPGEPVVRTGGNLVYRDMELPQETCASGRIARFGKTSEPTLTSGGDLFATGLSATGRLTSALKTTAFYGQPLVSWTQALGAQAYEVQWSKTQYPFTPESYPGNKSYKGFMTATTSAVLPVGPGTWWYRVRGYDYSLPTGVQQMAWSDPAKLIVARPTFKVEGGSTKKFKLVGKK